MLSSTANLQSTQMPDHELLQLIRSQRHCGVFTVRRYAEMLRRSATASIEQGDFAGALSLAEREVEFCRHAFGLFHPLSRAASGFLFAIRKCLQAGRIQLHVSQDSQGRIA